MIRMVPALVLAAAVALAGSETSFAQTAPADIVKARQDAMEKMWINYFKDIATTMRAANPDLALIAAKAAGASEHEKNIAQLFPPGTGRDVAPATRAKPEIWTQRADFEATLKTLMDATQTIASDAKAATWTKSRPTG